MCEIIVLVIIVLLDLIKKEIIHKFYRCFKF